ncbi:tumor necrosis factor receptor superfamily member 1B [Brachionichthys hirsutus]|uniref:tumor necrosis factor receptor superfamily member 1B n=1 Tax=Brachionichthys hirsutus TaxID=412623 RepID=UPI00360480E0
MKDIVALLVLLSTQAFLVDSLPYQTDSGGKCLNATEYLVEDSNLCCTKCQPGHRLKIECSHASDTVCEPCPTSQYAEGENFSPNCISCKRCKPAKGLLYVQRCSAAADALCGCRPGMYCIMGFDSPSCAECIKYRLCQAGYGVSVSGTADSNVKCEQCPEGTFSDTASSTDRCRAHTDCQGRAAVRKGNATADAACEPEAFIANAQPATKETHNKFTTMMITVSEPKAVHRPEDPTPSISLSATGLGFNHSAPATASDSALAAVSASVAGVILVFIAIILLYRRKTSWKKDAARFDPKIDANGNCATGDKINRDYWGDAQFISLALASPEQQCLLETGGNCSDQSQCSNDNETLARTDGCSSNGSIGPLQSIGAHSTPESAPSDPTASLSHIEPLPLQTGMPTQSSSQPTSPQIISPITTSPHVNVNITFHIGNGSGTTPSSVMPPDSNAQIDPILPVGEEEEAFSIPQQEAGKQSLMSVQESSS